MGYLRLTREDRYQIQALVTSGMSLRKISRQLQRHPSTILREVRKVSINNYYSAYKAHAATTRMRRRARTELHRIKGELELHIREKVAMDWSPEQISGRMQLTNKTSIPFVTIYRFIERDKAAGGVLWTHLRILRNPRNGKRPATWKPWSFQPDRVNICERPKIVEERKRLGDFERDTVLGKRGKSVLLSIVDRTSRRLKLGWIEKSTGDAIHFDTVRLLKNETTHTITNDNGFEFLRHRQTAKALSTRIYFANRYRSWERGTNENTNGLLRQYFPKKKDIGQPTRKYIEAIAERINSRPRKMHGYRTANEIHQLMSGVLR